MDITDRQWRLDNLYSIVNKDGNAVAFKRNNIQRKLSTVSDLRKMVLKSRQVGISTNELIDCLDFTIFNENKTVCILAHEQDAIEKLFRIVRRGYEFLPDEVKPELDRGGGSKYELFFPSINSRIYCDLESRGDTIHKLHVSEMAFMDELTRWKATIECVPLLTGQVTVETTPNGLNHFYQMWIDEQSNYKKCFYPWFFHEEYRIDRHDLTKDSLTTSEKEFIQQARSLYQVNIDLAQIAFRRFKQNDQKHLFKQEYPENDISCFLTSGNSPINLEIIKPMYDNAQKPVRQKNGIDIYREPIAGELYCIGADTAEGVEGDASTAHVFLVESRTQVATFWANDMKPSDFADKLIEMAAIYSGRFPILIGVERNNHGHSVLLKLDEVLKYPAIYSYDPENEKLGWQTDKVTRPIMIDTLIEGLENGTVHLLDKPTLGECLTLVNNNGKIEAESGNHDDRVVAAAIGVQMCIVESRMGIYAEAGAGIKV